MSELLTITRNHPLASITMMREEKRNALSPKLLGELSQAFDELKSDEDVRVVILKGQGNTFSAGADLAYLQKISENGPEENLADSRRLRDLLWKIYTFPKFTIAQVHGAALAGGCGLATVCDVIFAADDSQFGYTETAIGFIPALVSIFLVRKIGEQHARELLLSARKISAEEAYSLGLAQYVVPCGSLETAVQQYAMQVSKNSPSAIALTKSLLAAQHGMSLEAGLEYAASMNALARGTEDTKKGIAGFLKKVGLHEKTSSASDSNSGDCLFPEHFAR